MEARAQATAPGAPGVVGMTGPGGQPEVHYHFPVEIVVRAVEPADIAAITDQVLARLSMCMSVPSGP